MADKVVSVRLEAKTQGFTAGMAKAKASVDDLTKASKISGSEAFAKLADKAALAGVGVAAGIGVAVKKFMDFDAAMSAVKANSGATGKEFDDLRQLALQLGADTVFSATEAADGINELAKAGVDASNIMRGGLKGSLDLAAAGQLDVGKAAEIAATAMTQFNLSGDKVPHVADLLTNAANKAQGGVEDMGMALKQAGLVAASTGLSIEETTAGLTAFASAGLIGSDAGTSFKTMLQRLSAPTDEAKQKMSELGISAYDSQGNFVGLAEVAGQLKSGMEDLTPAQRNAAMATIFGSDAIRAANVLYDQGEQGIRKWTDAVSEQGAAAKQAATLTDNLKGDIEKLGGALDSVFIQTGSSANGSLRTLVQGITGLVDMVGHIPGPVLLAGGALTTFALLAPKGILMWRGYVAQLDALGLSLDKIAVRAPRAAAGLRAVGAAGAVIAGLSVVGAGMEGVWLDISKGSDEATDSLQAYIDKGKDAEGVSLSMKVGFGNLGASVEHAFGTENRNYVMGFFDEVGTGFGVFGADKLTEANQFFEQVDQGLSGLVQSGNAEAARKVFEQIATEAQRQGVNVDALKAKLPQYAAALDVAGTAASNAAGPTGALADTTGVLQEEAKSAEQALSDLRDAILGLGDPVAQQRAANRAYEEAIDALTGSIKENGKGLDAHTDAGRKNQAALDAIRDATLDKVVADFEATESTKGVDAATKVATETMKRGRKAFIDSAIAAGMTRDQAKDLADKLGLVPEQVKIKVSQSGAAQAEDAITHAARDQYATIWVTTKETSGGTRVSVGGVSRGRFAAGGEIPGSSPSPTADNILIKATAGEWMHPVKAVVKYGKAFMSAVQHGTFPVEKARGYATGGEVTARPRFVSAPVSSGTASASLDRLARILAEQGNSFTVNAVDPDVIVQRVMDRINFEALT